jgi:hypothetical protein
MSPPCIQEVLHLNQNHTPHGNCPGLPVAAGCTQGASLLPNSEQGMLLAQTPRMAFSDLLTVAQLHLPSHPQPPSHLLHQVVLILTSTVSTSLPKT